MNPVQHAFCNECGGRLLPSSAEPPASDTTPAIKGLSLPTKSPLSDREEESAEEPAELDEEAPAWLRELGARWPAEDSAAAAGGSEGGDDIPDWLKDLRASLPDDQEEELPEESEVPEWLAAMSSPASAAGTDQEVPSAGTEADETPDWLIEMRDTTEGERKVPGASLPGAELPEEVPEAEEGEVPDWLVEMRDTAGGEKEMPKEVPEAEEGEVPDWLAELRGSAGGEREVPEEVPEAEEGEVPDWLAELRGSAGGEREEPGASLPGAELPEEVPEAEEGEVPDWLAELRGSAGDEMEEPEEVPEAEEGEVPDWLAEMRVSAGAGEEPGASLPEVELPEEIPEAEEGEVPDWLAEMRVSAGAEWEEPGEKVPEIPEEAPDWMTELSSPAEEEEPEAAEPPARDEEEPIPVATVPGWLQELRPQAAGEMPSPAGPPGEEDELPDWLVPTEGETEETLARADIPEWLLALKPAELREEGEPEGPAPVVEEPVEETGLLAGLQGTLPVEMIIAQPRAVAETDVVEAPPTMDTPQARLFAEIVGRPPQAALKEKESVQPQRRLLAMLPRWLIYITLIAVVTLPLLLEEPLLPRSLEAATPVQNLYDEIELLDAEALVLVAFDYDPSTRDEMDVLAQVLIDHLMERQARIVAVSLYPAGPPVAQAVLDELAVGRPGYADAYGQHYVNLGYLPGQAMAVRLLGQSLPVALPRDFQQNLLADLPAVDGVTGVEDFALILELAASEQSVRWWVEQAATPYNVPLAGGVSALVAPLARPYYQTGARQLVGLVGGLPDAAAYETLRGSEGVQAGALATRLDSLTGGHLVFILVLAIGSVVQLLRGRGGGR